ncbi:phosphotransferase [Pseudonocardia alni]
MSSVLGMRLTDGSEAVVKVREDDGRGAGCVRVQAQLAERGFPCPRPLTRAVTSDGMVVHAEEFRPGGEVWGGDSPEVAGRYGQVFGWLLEELQNVQAGPLLPNPRWVRWDHPGPGVWPSIAFLDEKDQSLVPQFVSEVAQRARSRLRAADAPCVLGHADFEAQNLRWKGPTLWAIHDWDSVAWQPEAALVGAASGAFPRLPGEPPSLATIASSEAFVEAYQQVRGRSFTAEEQELVWAASLWPVAHNARWDALHRTTTSPSTAALVGQATDRLAWAGA